MRPQPNSRRRFLKSSAPASLLSVAAAAGLLQPSVSFAWFPFFNFNTPSQPQSPTSTLPTSPLKTRAATPVEALVEELRHAKPEISPAVDLMSPDMAVDGASIMLDFQVLLSDVDGIAIFIEGNPQPMAAAFHLAPNVLPAMKLLVRLAQSSTISVVARSKGQFYRNLKFVKVTHGGCSDSFAEAESKHRREIQQR